MELTQLDLGNFRCYSELSLPLQPGVTGLFGANGKGKTNLLEALFLAGLGWSFRTRHFAECLRFGSDEFWIRLSGQIHSATHRSEELTNSLWMDARGHKKVRLDHAYDHKNFSKLIGRFSLVYIGPDDIFLIQGSPMDRRSFMDSLLCQGSHTQTTEHNLHALKNYQHILKQRNALLKQEQINSSLFEIITEQWIQAAAEVVLLRRQMIEELNPIAKRIYCTIAPHQEELKLHYKTSCPEGEQRAEIEQFYRKRTIDRARAERETQTTLSGPHKDDLEFFLDNHLAKDYGSRGQQRSTALALRLACAEWLTLANKQNPILLLDDIFAELDRARREALALAVAQSKQTFIAAPEQSDIPFEVQQIWRVGGGRVELE